MHVTYRLFNGSLDDAAGVLQVEAACWNESPHSPHTLRALLTSDAQKQVCWLAEACGQIVGFLHAFLTHGRGRGTWELDLLAVHPDWRRRGIATRLVLRVTQDAPAQAGRARALVATHNTPSAKAFRRAVFRTDGRPHAVYVLDAPSGHASAPRRPAAVTLAEQPGGRRWVAAIGGDRLDLLEVRTLLYDGLWVVGLGESPSPELLQAALAHACQRRLDLVGLFVPLSNSGAVELLQEAGYESLGAYHVWTRQLPYTPSRDSGGF